MKLLPGWLALLTVVAMPARAQTPSLSAYTRGFVRYDAPVIALTHVRVIDGTGAAARADQTIVIDHGRIKGVGGAAETPIPAGAVVVELAGRSVLPGLVGMHDHLFTSSHHGATTLLNEVAGTFPRLYLANGVTTIRTTGSIEPDLDLEIKRRIDAGLIPGPKLHVTGPYLEGAAPAEQSYAQFHQLRDAADARRMVGFWADAGVTSFKAYMHITRAELAAAIAAAHARKLQVTAHLCSVRLAEAAALGIDDLEHAFFTATDFLGDARPDRCPERDRLRDALAELDVGGPAARALIRTLVDHHVALTSTLPVFEAAATLEPLPPRALDVMVAPAQVNALKAKAWLVSRPERERTQAAFNKARALELAFVRAGGLLVAGCDPTGAGAVLAGFADQREVELLVEGGFSPLEAIRIATFNGATLLGERARIGSIAAGKDADLLVVAGDPSVQIADIEKAELVFKDGVGYDPTKLIDSVRGFVGLQ